MSETTDGFDADRATTITEHVRYSADVARRHNPDSGLEPSTGVLDIMLKHALPDATVVHYVKPRVSGLPTDAKARKAIPIASGVLGYFPDAIAAVAEVSRIGNDQHNPGKPLRWRRGASTDHADCAIRHFMERGVIDIDGGRHTAKAAWRLLALLQMEIEADRAGMTYDAYIAKVQKEES